MTLSTSEYFNLESFQVKSNNLLNGEYRLNAEFYQINLNIIISEGVDFKPLSESATVLFPGIFKRILVDNLKNGIGFLTSSEMMSIEPMTDKFLSIDLTQNLNIYKVTDNTLLVSRSGTIGNTIYVNDDLKRFAITEDALRVIPTDPKLIGLLYFYFISDYGNGLITGKKSGAVIDHIYEEDLLRIPIPVFDTKKNDLFFQQFQAVKRNRELANSFIQQARFLVLQYNNLPPLNEIEVETLDPKGEVEIHFVNSGEFTNGYRLDAHFNSFLFKKVRNIIIGNSFKYSVLKDVCNDINMSNRFSRNFVNKGNGIQLLGTRDFMQIRPSESKYIAEDGLPDNVKIEKNWILLARVGSLGGTFGKAAFVWNNFENMAASDNIIRIMPNLNLIDEGYLYAFLSSDYGYNSIIQIRHGALQDALDPLDVSNLIIPTPENTIQRKIGDLVRRAYDLRAEAIRLEDEAQKILTEALTGK